MKRIVWFLGIVILISSCKQKAPDGIINRETMEEILYDIHVVDGYISTIYVTDSARKVGAAYYNGIYKKFDTDSVQYAKSLSYYSQNPKIMQEMYTALGKKIERQKVSLAKADSLMNKKRFKTDSLKIMKTFKADSLSLLKKMKADSSSKVKVEAQIKKKRSKADSLIATKRFAGELPVVTPTAVQ